MIKMQFLGVSPKKGIKKKQESQNSKKNKKHLLQSEAFHLLEA